MSEDVSTDMSNQLLGGRAIQRNFLNGLINAFRLVLLFQPSSAAADRVFSIEKHFTAQQQSSLEYYLGTLCYVAIQPCSTIRYSNLCLYFNITDCKKKKKKKKKRGILESKWVNEKAK